MKRYDKYKQTGSPWIGKIPSHWEKLRIKFLISNHADGVWGEEEKGNADDINCYRVADFDYDRMSINNNNPTVRNILKSQLNGRQIFNGDILLEKSGGGEATPVGRAVIANIAEPAVCSNFIHFLHIENLSTTKFLCYYFKHLYSNKVNLLFFNQTTGIQNLNIHAYLGQDLYLPPLAEQEAVAEYLDKKCGSIDAVIAAQERRIALLEELKQSVITEAVTHGINPNATLRPSGIDWIGKIPSHWDYKRLRFVCEFRNGYTPSKANPDFWTDGTIPWYRMEDIRDSGRHLKEAKQYVTEDAVKGGGLFDAGSFILATTATIGEHAVLIVDSLANQRFTNLKIRKSLNAVVDNEFFFYFLYVIDDYCKSTTKTATFAAVNIDDLKNFPVTIPPVAEQTQIVSYIKGKTASIDASIAKAKREIELLKELKQSVITEAVTGKIKVY